MAILRRLLRLRDPRSAAREALYRQAMERVRYDPLQGPKAGAREVLRVVSAHFAAQGEHRPESLLCALGALAGFACQVSARNNAFAHGLPERDLLTEDLNLLLFGMEYSVWALVAGAARHHGCNCFPEPAEIWSHVNKSVGTPQFGVPRIDKAHAPHALPADYLRQLWPVVRPLAERFCGNTAHWPVMFSLAVQQAIDGAQPCLDACLAMRIALESALPMARLRADFSQA